MHKKQLPRRSTSGRHNADLASRNPVAKSIAIHKMQCHLRSIGIEIFLTREGDNAKPLLAHLAWVIGLGAEIGMNTEPNSFQSKRLHGALRTVVQMAASGCHWQANAAEPIWLAAQDAQALLIAFPQIGMDCIAGADYISARIHAEAVEMTDVAGAEIYASLEKGHPR